MIDLRSEQMRGYRVTDEAMAPVFRPGQLVLVPAVALDGPSRLLGRDALVELPDGRTLLRRLMPSVDATRFDLAAYNAPTLPMVDVRAARSISGAIWPEAWHGRSSGGRPKSAALLVDEKF